MSRPLSPFIRHLGHAKERGRQLQAAVDQVAVAAIAVAGLTGEPAQLGRAIANAREQLAILERQSREWGGLGRGDAER